jgi:hypothetical protein
MSVAACLGVDDSDGPLLTAARDAWPGWCEAEPDLRVVDDLLDLREWTKRVSRPEANAVLARLAVLAAGDAAAAGVLAWLLVPGAIRIARQLSGLTPDIDAVVAGQLWLQTRQHATQTTSTPAVAMTILRETKHAVMAEFGIGEAGRRADLMWTRTTTTDRVGEGLCSFTEEDYRPDGDTVLMRLLRRMLADGELTVTEARQVHTAARYAEWLGVPAREKSGMTADLSIEVLLKFESKSAQTVRRRLKTIISKMVDYAEQNVDTETVLWSAPSDDEAVDVGEFLMAASSPRMAATLENFHRVFKQVRLCPHLGLVDPEDTEQECGCAPANTGCLIYRQTPPPDHRTPQRPGSVEQADVA